MTVNAYINRVRTKINDAIQPYRFTDAEVRESLSDALLRGKQYRPSIGYHDGVLVLSENEIAFDTAEITVVVRSSLDLYSDGVAYLAAARVLLNDNADTQNVALSEKWEERGMGILMS